MASSLVLVVRPPHCISGMATAAAAPCAHLHSCCCCVECADEVVQAAPLGLDRIKQLTTAGSSILQDNKACANNMVGRDQACDCGLRLLGVDKSLLAMCHAVVPSRHPQALLLVVIAELYASQVSGHACSTRWWWPNAAGVFVVVGCTR